MSVRQFLTSKRFVAAAAVPVAVLATGGVVMASSYSAFSATTTNPTSNWTAGDVALSDDDANTAMFTASNLKPGSTGAKCIVVSSRGSLPSAVKLYGTGYSASGAASQSLADNLNLSIEEGSGGSFSNCDGFNGTSIFNGSAASFGSSKTSWSTGVGSWAPAGVARGGQALTKTYKITYTVASNTPDSAQSGSVSLGLTWEAQNS